MLEQKNCRGANLRVKHMYESGNLQFMHDFVYFCPVKSHIQNLMHSKWKLLFVIETNFYFSKCSNVHRYALKWGFSRHVRGRKSVNNSRNKSFLRKFWDVKGFFVCLYFDKIRSPFKDFLNILNGKKFQIARNVSFFFEALE